MKPDIKGDPEFEMLFEIARGAGALTTSEMKRQKISPLNYYPDADVGMWVPEGILLFKPRSTVQSRAEAKARDHLEMP